MTAATTSVAGTVTSAIASAATAAVQTSVGGSTTLAGFILSLQEASDPASVDSICDQIIRTPNLPAGSIPAAEGIRAANKLSDPTAREVAVQGGVMKLNAINTAANSQLGPISKLFASLGL